MSYRRVLLMRWSRRDWLAVAVVALVTVFLVGATLTVMTAGDQIAGQAREYDADATVTHYGSLSAARENADEGAVVLPLARATVRDDQVLVVGVPPDAPRTIAGASLPWSDARLPPSPPDGRVFGPVNESGSTRLIGADGVLSVTLVPETNRSVLSPGWYVANADAVERLGADGAFVIDQRPETAGGGSRDDAVPQEGTVLLPVVSYLFAGTNSLLRALTLLTAGSGLLVAVALYSITRLTVRDRLSAVFVARATGGSPRQLTALFTARAVLVVTTGVALGYAFGVVTVNVVVNAAVSTGLLTTLDPNITARVVGVLVPELVALVALGTVASGLAVLTVFRRPPADLLDEQVLGGPLDRLERGRLRSVAALDVLQWRALVPTTIALTVFVVVALLTASLGVTFAPLLTPGAGVVTDPGAPHPLASTVDVDAATAIRAEGAPASPEIILPQVTDGQPYLARGADFESYTTLTDAELVSGRAPRNPDEAVVGRDLALTLGVELGDTVTLGGGATAGIARVTIVGVFRAPGIDDDQLIVSLSTAGDVSGMPPGQVHLIRTTGVDRFDELVDGDDADGATEQVVVTDVAVPRWATAEGGVSVTVTVRNYAASRATKEVRASVGNRSARTRVRVAGGATTDVTLSVPVSGPGDYVVRVDSFRTPVTVVRAGALRLGELPRRGPPNATLLVPVSTASGEPVADAPVSVGSRSARTNDAGIARVQLPATPGRYTVAAGSGDRRSPGRAVIVAPNASRSLLVDVSVTPRTVTAGSSARADLSLSNPWADPIDGAVGVRTANGTIWSANTTIEPGRTWTRSVRLPTQTAAGQQNVTVAVDGTERARTGYAVVSSDRLLSAIARSGSFTAGSALGIGVQTVLGNVVVLQWVLVALATVMVVGSSITGFAWTASVGRRTAGIYRVTGATPFQLARRVLVDAAKIGVASTALALALAVALLGLIDVLGLLVVFGVRIDPFASPDVFVLAAVGGVVLSLASAFLASIRLLRAPPATLLADPDAGTNQQPSQPGESGPEGFSAGSTGSSEPAGGDDDD